MLYKKREEIINGSFERDFIKEIETLGDEELQLLAALIANGTLDIKIAVTKGCGIYHDKLGIIHDQDGNTVIFYGSPNETGNGYENNYEKIRIVKSWVVADTESIDDEVFEFEALWNGTNPHVTVQDYTVSAQKNLLHAVESRQTSKKSKSSDPIQLRDYQKKAIDSWVSNKYHGFYVMATGTGKTWTAIYSAVELLKKKAAMVVIIAPYCGDGRLHDENDEEIRHIQFVKQKLSGMGFKSSQFTASENMAERMDLVEAFNEGAIDALAAIRCLDEGINIPSIEGALILSSNDDYREFVQRRGRILRLYGKKEYANIYDVVVLPSYETPKMAEIELRRFYEYARLAINRDDLLIQLGNIASDYCLELDDFVTVFDEGKEAELDD